MKNVLIIVLVLSFSSCGAVARYFAEIEVMRITIQGDGKKAELKAKGEADLLEAESSKKIAIEAAKAKFESSKMLAQAEVERAKGVAEANKIIGDSLKNNEGYLRYLYISNLEKAEGGGSQVIYIPTEAGLPILESGKRK